jgi:hypothetical protein
MPSRLTCRTRPDILRAMKLILALTCDGARERPDGKLDIQGIFNELNAPGFPAMQERMTAVFIVEWSDEEAGEQPLRADLVDEKGQRVLTIQGHTQVSARGPDRAPAQTRLVMPLQRVVFPQPGRYTFELVAAGDTVAACSVFVGSMPDQPGT